MPYRLILMLSLFLLATVSSANERILFIGNSFTYEGPVPDLVDALANDAGLPDPYIETSATGGARLDWHLNSDKSTNSLETLALIRAGNWDVVVLQEFSNRPTDSYGDPDIFKQDATELYDIIKEYNPNARVVLYQTWAYDWGRTDFYPSVFNNPGEMWAELAFNYNDAASNYIPGFATQAVAAGDVTVAPVGDAWELHRLNGDPLYLYREDYYHAGDAGRYLNALVLFGHIFNQSPIGRSTYLGLTSETAEYLQLIAESTLQSPLGQTEIFSAGESLLVDFGTIAASRGTVVSNLSPAIHDLYSDAGQVSNVDLQVLQSAVANHTAGLADSAGTWPANAGADGVLLSSSSDSFFELSGLDAAANYRLTLYASHERTVAGESFATTVTVNGQTQSIEAADNATETLVFDSLSASGGVLLVQVSSSGQPVINLMEITHLGDAGSGAGFSSGDVISLDLGSAYQTASFNLFGETSASSSVSLNRDDGVPSLVSITVTDAFSGQNSAGLEFISSDIPAEVSRDSFYVTSSKGSATLRFAGLDPDSYYGLELTASRSGTDGGRGRLTRYAASGQFVDLEVADNTGDIVALNGLMANAEGQLEVVVSISPDGAGRYAYLGGLKLIHEGAAVVTPAALLASPALIQLGDVGLGQSASGSVTVTNTGRTPTTITALEFTDGLDLSASQDCVNVELGYGDSCEIRVTLVPGFEQIYQDQLLIRTLNDAANTSAEVLANGVPYQTLFPVGSELAIDFGAANMAAEENVFSDIAAPATSALVANGAATGITLSLTAGFSGINTRGSLGTLTDLAAESLLDSFYVTAGTRGTVTLTGLEPNAAYLLELSASRTGDDSGRGRLTRYTVQGSTQDLEVADNTDQSVIFPQVVASATGEIEITTEVSPAANGRYAYLGALRLRHVGDVSSLPDEPVLSRNAIHFGALVSGDSLVETLTLQNAGGGSFGVVSLDISPVAADFSVVAETCTGQDLSAGQTCSIEIEYRAAAPGSSAASLQINTDSSVTSSLSAELTGQSREAGNGFQTGDLIELDFGGASTAAGMVAYQQGTSASLSLPTTVGQPSDILLQRSGSFAGTVTAGADASGVGIDPLASFDALYLRRGESVQFDLTGLDDAAVYGLTFYASRSGNDGGRQRVARYTVDGIAFDLDAADNIDNLIETTVVPNASGQVSIVVSVSPSASSRYAYLGFLRIEHLGEAGNLPDQPQLSATVLDFGIKAEGESASRWVTLSNEGGGSFAVTGLNLQQGGQGFTLVQDQCSGVSLAGGQSCDVQLQFTSPVSALYADTLIIDTDSAQTSSLSLQLSAEVRSVVSGFTAGDVLEVDFGTSSTAPGMNAYLQSSAANFPLLTTNGLEANVSLQRAGVFSGTVDSGSDASGIGIPLEASQDALWLRAGKSATFILTGLTPSQSYGLTLFASRSGNDGGRGRVTRYTLNGTGFDLDASSNSSASVDQTVTADSNGEVTIQVEVSPDSASRYGYLGFMRLTHP